MNYINDISHMELDQFFTFEIAGDENDAKKFIDNLEIKINNIFNNKGDGYNE